MNFLLSMEVIYTQFYKFSGRVRGRAVAKAEDRLWLDMCQLMICPEQIKRRLGLPSSQLSGYWRKEAG